jgi:hypothetical protein
MEDETLYPPKCCKRDMPGESVKARISEELATTFEKKKEELDTHTGYRTYCSEADCAVFIGAKHIVNDVATCPACNEVTCTMCKESGHQYDDCPADEALNQILELASDCGWQRCDKCKAMIDHRSEVRVLSYHVSRPAIPISCNR